MDPVDPTLINLFGIAVIAFAVPFVAGFFTSIRIPSVVLEIVAGIIVGPAVLGLLEVDDSVALMSAIGVALLLFLAGLDLDLGVLHGDPLRLGAISFGVSVALALGAMLVLFAIGIVEAPVLIAVALCATSVGIVVPVLRDTGTLRTAVGRFTVAGGAAAEFGSIVLLGVLFAVPVGTAADAVRLVATGVLAIGLFGAAVFALLWSVRRLSLWRAGQLVVDRLNESTSQIGTRAAILLVIGMAVIAEAFGFEPILGTFLAGIFLGVLIRGRTHEEKARVRLEGIGYGFFVPVFFIATGMRLPTENLLTLEAIGLIAGYTVLLLIIRGLPAILYRRHLGRRGTIAAGLMQATNLSFVVVAVSFGLENNLIAPLNGSALVIAGLVSAIAFPAVAQSLIARDGGSGAPALDPLRSRGRASTLHGLET